MMGKLDNPMIAPRSPADVPPLHQPAPGDKPAAMLGRLRPARGSTSCSPARRPGLLLSLLLSAVSLQPPSGCGVEEKLCAWEDTECR